MQHINIISITLLCLLSTHFTPKIDTSDNGHIAHLQVIRYVTTAALYTASSVKQSNYFYCWGFLKLAWRLTYYCCTNVVDSTLSVWPEQLLK